MARKPSELGVKALDQKTFQVTLSKPTPFFISMTNQINLAPLPKEIAKKSLNPNGLRHKI